MRKQKADPQALVLEILAIWIRPIWRRCMICRMIDIGAPQRVHERLLGISGATEIDWPSAGISDGFCGAACQATFVEQYCGGSKKA